MLSILGMSTKEVAPMLITQLYMFCFSQTKRRSNGDATVRTALHLIEMEIYSCYFLFSPCKSQISRVRWITEIPIGLHFAFNYYNHLNCMIKSYNSYLSSKCFSKLDLKDLNMIYSFIVLFAYFRMFTLMDKSPKHLSKYLRVSILLFPTDRNFNFFWWKCKVKKVILARSLSKSAPRSVPLY